MGNRENSTVERVFSDRPKKNEERVYLDQELVDYLDHLQAKLNFRRRSQALRHCIVQQRARELMPPTSDQEPAGSISHANRQLQGASQRRRDRAGSDPASKNSWLRKQAAIAIMRPPPEQNSAEREAFRKEALGLAEPLAAGIVDGVGELLTRYSEKVRQPKRLAAGVEAAPSLVRTVAADAVQAAVTSGQRALLNRMGQYFERKKRGKS